MRILSTMYDVSVKMYYEEPGTASVERQQYNLVMSTKRIMITKEVYTILKGLKNGSTGNSLIVGWNVL